MATLLLVAGLAGPARSPAAWHQPVDAPLNAVAGKSAGEPSAASVFGLTHVAWDEATDAGVNQIRVRRLESDGKWHLVGDPFAAAANHSATEPSIAGVGRVPYVAWVESTANNHQIRAARFGDDGKWHVFAAPLYADSTKEVGPPSIASVGGVPYVTWAEDAGTNYQIRVARLENDDNWHLVGGALYADANKNAESPSIAAVSDPTDIGSVPVPYVAWVEGGTPSEVRVARLQNDGNWHLVGDALPAAAGKNAVTPSIASVLGVPYVAWKEYQGLASEVRVGRLGNDGKWTLVGGALHADPTGVADSPSINERRYVAWHEFDGSHSHVWLAQFGEDGLWHLVSGMVDAGTTPEATHPSLGSSGIGTPIVAWQQADGGFLKVRAARLEPDFLSSSAVPTRTGAKLTTRVRVFGLKPLVGFKFGTALERETPTERAIGPSDEVFTIEQTVTGLSPAKTYKFRPFVTQNDLQAPAVGPIGVFRPDVLPPSFLSAAVDPDRFAVGSNGGTKLRLKLSEKARVVFTIARNRPGRRVGGKCVRRSGSNAGKPKCTRHTRAGRFTRQLAKGKSVVPFSGRVGGKNLKPGRYRLRLVATDALANSSVPRDLKFRIVAG